MRHAHFQSDWICPAFSTLICCPDQVRPSTKSAKDVASLPMKNIGGIMWNHWKTYSVIPPILSHLIAPSSWLLPACQILSNCRGFSASLSSQAWVSTFAQKVQQRPHAQSYHLRIWKLYNWNTYILYIHIYPFRLGPRGWYRMVCPRCTSYKMNPMFTDVSLYYPWGIRFCNKNFNGNI
jgi:hypothetical protein